MTEITSPIKKACDIVKSQAEMARILGVSPSVVSQWITGRRPVPLDYCLGIEAATGGRVTRSDIRPNDWKKIWPDFSGKAQVA